ncbi:MAG: uL15 family ribosomal protein [Candidatus Wildermuthbacteria bacterium]|nr:uL15 family ribosomal protein [Candidatus Wildermuthbacteria bacterium]
MQIHEIQPKTKQRKARRIGRGGKKGTYSGRGMKGQKSRAGHRMSPKVRELLKRYPKLRGSRRPTREKAIIVKLSQLEKHFQAGETVNPAVLAQKKIAGKIKGVIPGIKILGDGEITKALTIEDCVLSKRAREKIVKAGGTIK